MIRLVLPWPISINAYWKSRILTMCGPTPKCSTYVTAAGVNFQKEVLAAVIEQLGRFPHTRGGEPVAENPEPVRTIVFPTHVGVNRSTATLRSSPSRVFPTHVGVNRNF